MEVEGEGHAEGGYVPALADPPEYAAVGGTDGRNSVWSFSCQPLQTNEQQKDNVSQRQQQGVRSDVSSPVQESVR